MNQSDESDESDESAALDLFGLASIGALAFQNLDPSPNRVLVMCSPGACGACWKFEL